MKMDHVGVYFADLEGAGAFVMKYFVARSNEMYHNPRTGLKTYFLSFGGSARLEIMSRPGLAAAHVGAPGIGYAHMSLSVGGKEAVDALTERLRADGFKVVDGPRTTGAGCYESSVVGAEGILLEITA